MLHNLIRNAKEAGQEADRATPVTIRITSRTSENDQQAWLELELTDDGPGFPAIVLDKPFEPYVTDKTGGSGLGLAICRKIVGEHDGKISLSNRVEGGAMVRILFPLKLPVSAASAKQAAR